MPNLIDQLKAERQGAAMTALERYTELLRQIASGQNVSTKAAHEFEQARELLGFDLKQAESHLKTVRQIVALESSAGQDSQRDEIAKLKKQIADEHAKFEKVRKAHEVRMGELRAAEHQARATVQQALNARQELDRLESDFLRMLKGE